MNSPTITTWRSILADQDIDTIHIYEHVLIRSFEHILDKHGFSQSLYGWVDGHSFDGLCLLECGFYQPEVADLFSRSIGQPTLHLDYLDEELTRIQAEDSALYRFDRDKITQVITDINVNAAWVRDNDSHAKHIPEASQSADTKLLEPAGPADLETINIHFGLKSPTLSDQVILLSLCPIIFDAINRTSYRYGLYEQDAYLPEHSSVENNFIASLTLETTDLASVDLDKLESDCQKALLDITSPQYKKDLDAYLASCASPQYWRNKSVDYIKHSGLSVTHKYVIDQLSAESASTLLNHLKLVATA